jgi:hypothetical protein
MRDDGVTVSTRQDAIINERADVFPVTYHEIPSVRNDSSFAARIIDDSIKIIIVAKLDARHRSPGLQGLIMIAPTRVAN